MAQKISDADMLRIVKETGTRIKRPRVSFTEFRRQFDAYQAAKRGENMEQQKAARPHIKFFRQP